MPSVNCQPSPQSADDLHFSGVDVSIVIVSWNVRDYLQQCLQSIQRTPRQVSVQVIVVDNNSSDGSVELLRDEFPCVEVIANSTNQGFARANNQGFERAVGRYILILNPDTVLLGDCLLGAIDYLNAHPDVGMVGCKNLTAAGTVQIGCVRQTPGLWSKFVEQFFLWRLLPRLRWFAAPLNLHLDYEQVHVAPIIPGSFMLTRADVLNSLGGFDTSAFLYDEDTDLCMRFWKSGHTIVYLPWLSIIHYGGRSSAQALESTLYEFFKAEDALICKHYTRRHVIVFRLIVFFGTLLRIIPSIVLAQSSRYRGRLSEMLVVYRKVLAKTIGATLRGRIFRQEPYLD